GTQAPELFDDAPPTSPLRVPAGSLVDHERVIERVPADSCSIVKRDEQRYQPILPAPAAESRILLSSIGNEPRGISREGQNRIYVREQLHTPPRRVLEHLSDRRRDGIARRIPCAFSHPLAEA